MVTTLLKLRYRLLANNLKSSIWQLLGYIFSCFAGLWIVALSLFLSVSMGIFDPAHAGALIVIIGSITAIGWVLTPFFLGGVDTTIDSRSLLQFPLTAGQRRWSLLALGLFGIPGLTTIFAATAACLVWLSVPWLIPVALLSNLLAVISCILASRAVISLLSSFGSGRKTQAIIGTVTLVLLMMLGPIMMLLADLGSNSAGVTIHLGEFILGASDILAWLPFGAAWAVPLQLFEANYSGALLCLAIAVANFALFWFLWSWGLKRELNSAVGTQSKERVAASGSLSWIGKAKTGGAGASWARAMIYWLRDPRYLRQLISVPLLFILLLFVFGFQTTEPLMLLIAPLIAFILASVPYVDISYDGTAFSTVWQTGITGRDERLGRMGAAATIALPISIGLAVILLILHGDWAMAPAIIGATVGITLIGLGVCAVSSAVMVIPVAKPDDSPFKRVTGVTFQMNLFFALVWLIEFALCLPIVSVLIPTFISGETLIWSAITGLVSLGFGALIFWLGVKVGGKTLDKNGSNLLAQLKAYQGI